MKTNLLILNLIYFLLLNSCSFIENKNHLKKISNDKENTLLLFEKSYKSRDVSLFDSLYFNLNKKVLNDSSVFCIRISDSLNFENEIVSSFNILTIENDEINDYSYLATICIKNFDSIIVNGEIIKKNNNIEYILAEYFCLLNNKQFENSFYYNELKNHGVAFQLLIDISKQSCLSVKEWKNYFDCLQKYIQVVRKIREQLAFNEFGKSFNSLSINNKKESIKNKPIIIDLFFSIECTIIKKPSQRSL